MDWQNDWQTYQEQQQDGTTEAEKKTKPNDRQEEAVIIKKEIGKDYDPNEEALRERERIRIQGNKRYEEKQKREKEDRRDRR